MIRTQISLTEEQMAALRRMARQRRVSMASLVRGAVDAELERGATEAAWDRAMRAAGAFDSRLGDVAERHDDYLAQDFLK